jgi:ABC-type transport system involved in multi-copper enzyme maturation permease subunit
VVLIGAQMIAAEFQWDTWKLALTTSVPRWAVYTAKWLVGTLWILALGVAGWAATALVGVIHHASGPANLLHWLQFYLLGAVLMAAMLPLHNLITLITRNFFVTSGFGIVATFAGVFIMQSKYAPVYPLSGAMVLLSKYLGQTIPPESVGTFPVWVGIQVGVAVLGLLGSLLYTTRADYR